ncbi:hypothetical protein BKH41_04130 [Helicobacter sp. 12S02232-10]|uniref:type IV secretion system protein n=1 Tax=Helicobacter sp. 12S02232-10 TaxID=1476197 RepID=UPI000BA5B152|nr:type IV secretion system protein [Helicobacter sp. 12S02232-10]PAF48823.1 hypothetical protein BKH41_04130 [Helicobacter sp. 12S02232-10]
MDSKTNLFEILAGIFNSLLNNFTESMAKNFSDFLHTQLIINTITMLLILLFFIKKLKSNELFEFKTSIELIIFICFLGVYNWSKEYPQQFNEAFNEILFYLSNKISNAVQTTGASNTNQANVTSQNQISVLIQKIFNAIEILTSRVFKGIGAWNFFSFIIPIILTLAIAVIEILFILMTCYFVFIVFIEITIYKAFALLIMPLVFFSQTRGLAYTYIKKILSLTFYQPLILLLATLNFKMIDELIKYMPLQADIKERIVSTVVNGVTQNAQVSAVLAMILIMCFLCLLLIKKIPGIIDAIFGTSTGVQGMGEMSKMAMGAAGAVAGGLIGAAKSGFKAGSEKGGGGWKGLATGLTGAGLNMVTAGLGTKIAGSKIGESLGNGITKGVSFGTSQIAKAFGKGDKK